LTLGRFNSFAAVAMDIIFNDFGVAMTRRNGYELAQTLNPELSDDMLRMIYKTANHNSIKDLLKRHIRANTQHLNHVDLDEIQMWVDVFFCYWKTCGELLAIQEQSSNASWVKVYEAWKELFSALHRGYMSPKVELPAWTIPCLYVVGKYLRVFALNADEERSNNPNQETTGTNFQDDLDMEADKFVWLRDCGVQLNRMFTLCLNDR
jgi:hypothetical protein